MAGYTTAFSPAASGRGIKNYNKKTKPASETIIIYDESSAPSADDPASLLKLRRKGHIIYADYSIETYLYIKPAAGTPVSYARIIQILNSTSKDQY